MPTYIEKNNKNKEMKINTIKKVFQIKHMSNKWII